MRRSQKRRYAPCPKHPYLECEDAVEQDCPHHPRMEHHARQTHRKKHYRNVCLQRGRRAGKDAGDTGYDASFDTLLHRGAVRIGHANRYGATLSRRRCLFRTRGLCERKRK